MSRNAIPSIWPLLKNVTAVTLLFGLVSLIGTHYDITPNFGRRGPNIVVETSPLQAEVPLMRPWKKGDYVIYPRASYQVRARIVFKRNYWLSAGGDISPIDYTLAWGPMSDLRISDNVTLSSGMRHYSWNSNLEKYSAEEINDHIANTHLVPRDDRVLQKLRQFHEGDVVTLKGYLVDMRRPDGWEWTTSTTRDDSGQGACEVMWVDSVSS